MALYAENHVRLVRLFEPQHLAVGRYVSSVGDGLDVVLDVIEMPRLHRRTATELRASAIR